MNAHMNHSGDDGRQEHGAAVRAQLVGSWILVGVPLGYGVFQTLTRAAALFG